MSLVVGRWSLVIGRPSPQAIEGPESRSRDRDHQESAHDPEILEELRRAHACHGAGLIPEIVQSHAHDAETLPMKNASAPISATTRSAADAISHFGICMIRDLESFHDSGSQSRVDQRRTTNDERPTTNDQRPMTNDQPARHLDAELAPYRRTGCARWWQ